MEKERIQLSEEERRFKIEEIQKFKDLQNDEDFKKFVSIGMIGVAALYFLINHQMDALVSEFGPALGFNAGIVCSSIFSKCYLQEKINKNQEELMYGKENDDELYNNESKGRGR